MDNNQDSPRPTSSGSRPDPSSSGSSSSPARDAAGPTAPLPATGGSTPPGGGATPSGSSAATPPGAGPTLPQGPAIPPGAGPGMPPGGGAPPPGGGAPPPGGGAPPPPPPPPSWGPDTGDRLAARLRTLRRSRNERVVAGVCGGVGRGLGIDPLLLRVVIVVLTIFGGAGVVLYALGWLLLPVDDGEPSLGSQLTHRGTARSSQALLLAIVLAAAVTLGIVSAFRQWDGLLLLSLAAVGFVVYLMRQPAPPTAVMGGVPGGGGAPAGVAGPTTSSGGSATGAGSATASMGGSSTAGSRGPTTATAVPPRQGPPGYPPAPPQPPVPPPPAPPRERSMLGGLTLSAVLLALGVLAAVDVSGADLPHGVYPATALTVLGLGLLVGAWLGRARGLVWLGVVLAVITLAAAVTSPWQDRVGRGRGVDLELRPTSVSELPANAEYSAGQVQYDLTAVPFEGQSARLGAQIGFGELIVTVPRNVDVTVHASTGVGAVDLLGGDTGGGFGTDRNITNLGPDGPGGGTLDLDLQVGFGHVEVRRAAA